MKVQVTKRSYRWNKTWVDVEFPFYVIRTISKECGDKVWYYKVIDNRTVIGICARDAEYGRYETDYFKTPLESGIDLSSLLVKSSMAGDDEHWTNEFSDGTEFENLLKEIIEKSILAQQGIVNRGEGE